MYREIQFLVSQIVTRKVFQRTWRRNSHEPHLWRAEEAWLIHEMFQFKLIVILFRLWKMWQKHRDIITTKLLKGVKYFKYIITCGFHDCSVKFYNFKVVMRWERRNRCGRCQNTVIFNVRLSVYRRYMHTSQYRFRIFTFEDFLN